jgi:hypothetical protein
MSDDPETIDPAIEARAREWLRRTQTADVDTSQWHDWYRPTAEHVRMSAELLGPLGEPIELKFVGSATDARSATRYSFHVTFPAGRLLYGFGLWPDGKINYFGLKPIPGETNPLAHLLPAVTES